MWVNAKSSQLCERKGDLCAQSGTYDANSSSTYAIVNSDFNISYVDGSGALGDYVTDTLKIGGQTLQKFQFGVGYESSSPQGVCGIGYTTNEAEVQRAGARPYANLPQAMVNDGLIQSSAYSLWLNDLEANTGQVLFGGVNTAKYHGSLETLPIIQEDGEFVELLIALTNVGLTVNGHNDSLGGNNNSLPTPVLLDSGSSLSYLPDDIAANLFDAVGAQFDQQSQAAYVPCDLANNDSSVTFTFSSPVISVPMSELVEDAGTTEDGNQITFPDGTPACIFGIAPAEDSTPVFGDTFIRSAYLVYDLANNQISIAQTNFNATSNDIREIANGTSGVPDATAVSNPVTTLAVGGGAGARNGGSPTAGTVTLASNPTATATGAAMQTQAPLALVAGAAAGLVLAAL